MCIALISTAHPSYSLILLDNRDEYLNRPTAPAGWWPAPNSHVLGGRDLLRPIQGTWLGITKQGRIAVLTNFREEGNFQGLKSRGEMVNAFLKLPVDSKESTKDFVEDLVAGDAAKAAGGFSLACGRVGEPLAIVSNRVSSVDGIEWVAKGKGNTVGLSNTAYGDRSWPKVVEGEYLMRNALSESFDLAEGEDELIQRLLRVLSVDTLPKIQAGEVLETFKDQLRNSVFIPAVGSKETNGEPAEDLATAGRAEKMDVATPEAHPAGSVGMEGLYGTQKQTVVLVDRQGRVRFFERTLFDENAEPIPIGKGDREFEFAVEGWKARKRS